MPHQHPLCSVGWPSEKPKKAKRELTIENNVKKNRKSAAGCLGTDNYWMEFIVYIAYFFSDVVPLV
jgi:hypothetical protein